MCLADLVPSYLEVTPRLDWKLPGFWRPSSKPHDLNVASIRRLKPKTILKLKSTFKQRYFDVMAFADLSWTFK